MFDDDDDDSDHDDNNGDDISGNNTGFGTLWAPSICCNWEESRCAVQP
jgi:hypothetical protein